MASSDDRQYFPVIKGEPDTGAGKWLNTWVSSCLTRMNEPILREPYAREAGTQFRLLRLPARTNNPIALRGLKEGDNYVLHARQLDHGGGGGSRRLVEEDRTLTQEESQRLSELFAQLNFSQMPIEDRVRGIDGETWILEGVQEGAYRFIKRWTPQYHTQERNLLAFVEFGRYITALTTLFGRPSSEAP